MNDQELQIDPQRVVITQIDLSVTDYIGILLKVAAAQFVIGLVFVFPVMCIYGALVGDK